MNTLSSRKVIFGASGIACVLLAGIYASTFQSSNTSLLSKFTNTTNVTNQNAATLWQASNDNPFRIQLGSLASKTDLVVVAILKKGTTLSPAGFNTFLSNLNSGITGLSKKPAYVGNEEVQNIIGYLVYEIAETQKVLAANSAAFDSDLASVIDASIPTTPTPVPTSCGGITPTGTGVYKTEKGAGGIQDTEWRYVENNGTYTSNNFGSTACKWTCANGFSKSGNSCSPMGTPTTPNSTLTLKIVTTDNTLVNSKSTFTQGEKVFGFIEGGDPTNTWACLDVPGENKCLNRSTWRQLTKNYNGQADEWQLNTSTKRIELKNGLLIGTEYPAGDYKINIANGQQGEAKAANITVKQGVSSTKYSWLPVQSVFGGCGAEPVCNASNVGAVRQASCGATENWTCTAVNVTNN